MRHMRSRRILAILLALSMIFGLLTTTAFAGEVDQNTSNVGESAANGTSEGGSGEGQSSGASEDESSKVTNKEDVPTEEETNPEQKKTTSDEEVDTQEGEGKTPVEETTYVASIGEQGYASLDAAIQAAVDGDTVTLLGNVELTETLTISSKDITLDVGSNTLTVSTSSDGIVVENATLTLASSGSGKYVFNCSARGSDGIYVNNTDASTTSTLNLNGDVEINVQASVNSAIHAVASSGNAVINIKDGKITATGSGKQFKAIHVDQNATLNMAGGELDITVDFDSYSDNNDVVGVLIFGNSSKQENCHVVISDGIFKVGGKNAFAQVVQVGMVNGYSENCDVSITGGTVKLEPTENGTGYVYAPYKASYATAAISGGTVTGTVTALVNAYISDVTNDGLTVTGGTFTNILADEMSKYLPEGTTYDETTGKVSSGSSEKLIETSEELAQAIANASDGDTIKLAEGEFTTYSNASPKKSLTFVGSGEGTVWTIGDLGNTPGGEKNGDYSFDGCDTITFKNMTLKSDGADYRGFIRISNTIVVDCVLSGKTAYWGYETAKFINSKFNAPEGDYALWDYSSKSMSFDGCEFNISGKGVNVYVEAGNAGSDARKVEVKDCTVTSTKENKAFLNIKNSTQAYDVTISGNNTVNGLAANGTTGSNLYQVETTEVTEASGKPLTVKQVDAEGIETILYQVKKQTGVATVDGVSYDTLDAAFAALNSTNHTLTLLDDTKWDAATPVYWAAGTQNGYEATLAAALTAAYKAKADAITIICRPNADVGEMTHGHVADDLTIYGNNAYVSAGECDLEVDTFKFDRNTGKQATDGVTLDKDITITAYELDNLGVWGQRNTNNTVNVNLTDCDTVHGITVQRVYISGTTGMNNITLSGCDFVTKATSVYSNADGEINITDCSFTGAQVPVNFNHKADGAQTVTVTNSTFTSCGDNGDWKQFAAPVRFVNSGSGSQTATVDTCTFAGTVGTNGDILIGDGRTGEKSNDVSLTVTNTEATVMAQKPGYYTNDGTTDNTLKGEKVLTASESLTVSTMDDLIGGSTGTTKVAKVGETEYETLAQAIAEAGENSTVTLLADVNTPETTYVISKSLTIDLNGKTITGSGYDGVFQIDGKGAHVLIKNGNVVAVEQSGTEGKYTMAVWACAENCVVTLQDLKVTQNITHTDDKQMDMIYTSKGKIIINSGSFTSGTPAWTLNCKDAAFKDGSATIIVNGGEFVGFDPRNNKAEGTGTSFVADGVGVDYGAETSTFTAKANMTAQLLDADGNSVKAYTSLADAITAAAAGQTVRLLANAKEDVTINKNITLDLGGKTLTNTNAGHATITIANGATATVKNGSVVGGTSYYNIQNNGTATFEDLTAKAGNYDSSMIDNYGSLTITSGTYSGGMLTIKNEGTGVLNISGGSFELTEAINDDRGNTTAVIYNFGKATISGGTFTQSATTPRWAYPHVVMTGYVAGESTAQPTTEIKGGTFTSKHTNGKIFHHQGAALSSTIVVSGGTFNKSVSEFYWADGFEVKKSGGSYVAQPRKDAQIGTATYSTLADALEAAKDGDTIRLLHNVTIDSQLVIDKAININLNNMTLTSTWAMKSGASGADRYAILVNAKAKLYSTQSSKPGKIVVKDARAIGAYAALELKNVNITQTVSGNEACVAFCANDATYSIENCTITGSYSVSNFANNATISIVNSKLIGTGNTLYHNGTNYGLKLTVTNTRITSSGSCGVYISGSTTTVEQGGMQQAKFTGCTISGTNGVEVKYTDLTLDNCTVSTTATEASYPGNNNGPAASGFAVVSTDNTVDKAVTPKPEGTVTITGANGNYTGPVGLGSLASIKTEYPAFKDETIKVSGGTFSSAIPYEYCAAGYIPEDKGDGKYGVKEGTYVAEVNGKQYETLQAAIDAASKNQTVKLIADTTENVTMKTPYLTLDLNGHTLNGGQVKGKPALTVTTRVTVKDSSADMSGTIMREDTEDNSGVSSHYVIDVQGAGWLTFESGNVINNSGIPGVKGASLVRVGDDTVAKYPGLNIKGGNFQQDNFIAIKVDRGDLFLNGGTITSKNSYAIENWHRATIKGGTVNGTVASWTYSGGSNSTTTIIGGTINGNVNSVNYGNAEGKTAKVTISGGTVNGELDTRSYDPTTNELTSIDDAAKATIGVTGGTFSKDPTKYVVEGSSVTTNSDGTFGVEKAYLCKVGETKYYTMEDAFKAQTTSGEPIVLLRDYTTGSSFPSGSINRTVDLDGHTWTYTGSDVNSAAFEVNHPNVMLTVKNGTVVSNSMVGLIPTAIGGTIKYPNSGLVFEKVEATANGHSGIETNGGNESVSVTLKDSTLNVPNGFGIYFPSSGTLMIDNSKITAKTLGVQVCSGNLDISGAETKIEVTGDGVEKTENDGAIQDGAAISIVNRAGYKGLDKITVTEGTFKAKSGNAAVKAYNWANQAESDFTESNKVAISGGTFSSAVAPEYCAEGFEPKDNGDGTYGVQPDGNVAEIGSMKYKSLDEALKAAKDGETVKLLKDAELEEVVIRSGRTLDLNGHTLKADYVTYFGGNLVDNSAAHTGLLKVLSADEILFTKNKKIDAMTQIPIYSLEKQGYVFEEIVLRVAPVTNKTPGALQAVYRPRQKDGKTDLSDAQKAMFGRANGHPVTATFRLVYKYKNSNEVQTFEFDFVDTYMDIYLNQNLYMYVTVTGLDIANIETITVTPVLKSAGGQVELVGKTIDTAAVLANLIGQ